MTMSEPFRLDALGPTAGILWRGKYLIVAAVVLGIVGAEIATRLSQKVYSATAVIQVQSNVPTGGAEVLGLQQASQGLAATYAHLITARSFLARIRPQVAGGRYSTDHLVNDVSASAVSDTTQNTNLILLSASGGSPGEAVNLGNAVASAFVQTVESDSTRRAQQQQQQLQGRISALTAQIDKLNATGGGSAAAAEQIASLRAARAALTTELASGIAQAVGQEGSVEVVAPATAPATPVSPRPLLNLLLGLALGLVVGIGLAWLRNAIDRGLHSSDEIQPLVDVPVLASVPLRRGTGVDDLVTREAYDVLRTNLTFVSVDAPVGVLAVTSYEAGEGKTATSEGLAHAAARRDLNVLLVDGDLRTSALSSRLGAGGARGLTNLMLVPRDARKIDEVVQTIGTRLSLLPAGPTPPNTPSVLASPRMSTLIADLRERYDLIIIDTPPIGHLADAALITALSDASLLVARVGKTRRKDLVSAGDALRRTPTPLVGVVVFEPRSLDSAYYPAGGSARAKKETAEKQRGSAKPKSKLKSRPKLEPSPPPEPQTARTTRQTR